MCYLERWDALTASASGGIHVWHLNGLQNLAKHTVWWAVVLYKSPSLPTFRSAIFIISFFYFYLNSSFFTLFVYSYHSLSLHSFVIRNRSKMYSTMNFKTLYLWTHLPFLVGNWLKPFVCVTPCSSVRLKSGIVQNEITFPRKVYFVKYRDIQSVQGSIVKVIVIAILFMVTLKIQMLEPSCVGEYFSEALISIVTLRDFIHRFKDYLEGPCKLTNFFCRIL